jgi:hypothetical protein
VLLYTVKLKEHYEWIQLLKEDLEDLVNHHENSSSVQTILELLCTLDYEIIHVQGILNDMEAFISKECLMLIN